jgi:hypothetical protein
MLAGLGGAWICLSLSVELNHHVGSFINSANGRYVKYPLHLGFSRLIFVITSIISIHHIILRVIFIRYSPANFDDPTSLRMV